MLLSYLRTICLYLVLILVVRLMGKRQIGEMEPAEFVVTMLIANLAAIPMQDSGIPLLSGLVPILTVLGVQLILAVASMRFISFRRLLCGKPVILIREGTIDQTNLRRARITLDELTEHLREREVLDLGQVQYAILETNGQISVFPYPQYKPASAKDAGLRVPEHAGDHCLRWKALGEQPGRIRAGQGLAGSSAAQPGVSPPRHLPADRRRQGKCVLY